MTLSEKIVSLRTAHKLSQGDLAEKLDVSRQSVSKWETGASIPELEKLIMISDLFHVSLDELVKSESITDDKLVETEPASTTYVVREKQFTAKQITGYILLGAGLLGCILGFIFSTELLVISICVALYGVIFLLSKKHTGLICGWFTVLLILVPSLVIFGRGTIPLFSLFANPGLNIFTIVSYVFWALVIVMVIVTVKIIVGTVRTCKNKNSKKSD